MTHEELDKEFNKVMGELWVLINEFDRQLDEEEKTDKERCDRYRKQLDTIVEKSTKILEKKNSL